MPAQKGSLFLLQVGNGGSPTETFTTIGGMRINKFALNSQTVESSNKDSGAWRALLAGAGIRSVTLTGSGIFTDSASEETTRANAFAATINNYKISLGNGDSLVGPFQISNYERSGNFDGEEQFSVTLESAGTVVFTAV